MTSAANRSGYFAPEIQRSRAGWILAVEIHARRVHVVFLGDEVDDVQHVLLGALVLDRRPAVGRCGGVGARDAIRAAVVRLPQRPVAHGRHHQVAAPLGVDHQIVVAAIGVVHARAGAQRDQQRQPGARRPSRRHEQTIGNRLAGAGEVVHAVLLADVAVERRPRIGMQRRRRGRCLRRALRCRQGERRRGRAGEQRQSARMAPILHAIRPRAARPRPAAPPRAFTRSSPPWMTSALSASRPSKRRTMSFSTRGSCASVSGSTVVITQRPRRSASAMSAEPMRSTRPSHSRSSSPSTPPMIRLGRSRRAVAAERGDGAVGGHEQRQDVEPRLAFVAHQPGAGPDDALRRAPARRAPSTGGRPRAVRRRGRAWRAVRGVAGTCAP